MYSISRVGSLLLGVIVFSTATYAAPLPAGFPATIVYNPPVRIVQGNQPLLETYTLTVTGPHTLPAGSSVTVPLVFSVLKAPSGATDALSFVSASPSSLTFTAPSQQVTTVITVNVPLGNYAGDYAWLIKPSGWPASLNVTTDPGATINATVAPAVTNSGIKPTVVITSPISGSLYTYVAQTGIPVVFEIGFTAMVAAGGTFIDSVSVKIAGPSLFDLPALPVTYSVGGVGTLSATGSVMSPGLTEPGIYTITAIATNKAGVSEPFSITIKIVVDNTTPPPPPPPAFCANIEWLTPISHDSVVKGGSTMPIKFTLSCDGKFVRDESVVIAIYEVYPNGTMSTPVFYPYGKAGPNPPNYSINGHHYHLNFPTAVGTHRYRIDVYHPFSTPGTTPQLLGTKDLVTR